ncbi:unnamed protein product, partial [Symbiodinium sp. CCMP2592]
MRALSRSWGINIVVIPADSSLEPEAFTTSQAKHTAALWLEDKHVDLLVPETGTAYPAELLAVRSAASLGFRAGGKSVASVCSKPATVWSFAPAPSWKARKCTKARTEWSSQSSQAPAQALSKPPTVWSASSSVPGSVVAGPPEPQCIDDLDAVSASVACKPPTERQVHYWGRAGLQLDRSPVAICSLCPFRAVAKCVATRQAKLYAHYKTHHPGQIPSGVPHGKRQPSIIQAKAGDNCHWRCPLCDFGIAARDAFSKSADAVTADKLAHRCAAHPRVPWARFKALDRKSTIDKAAVTRRGRESIKRIGAARGTPLEHFRLFCWPRATPSKVFAARGGLRSSFGWLCLECKTPFRQQSEALSHAKRGLCDRATAKRKAKRRVEAVKTLTKAHAKQTPEGPVKKRESVSSVDAICNFLAANDVHICTIAEADINVASAPGFLRAWKARGFYAALSVPEDSGLSRVALVSSLPFRPFRLAEGHQAAASAQISDILAACTAGQGPFVVAGDMNLEPAEAVLGEALAAGDASGKRRIDHGVCHWSLAASAVWHLEPSFSDHLSVVYELPLDTPQFMTMPPRSKVCDASSDDLEQWLGEADFDPFWLALATGDVDKGWQELSNVAENCLCHTRSGALRAIAASFSNKAAGPDCWRAKDVARLPNRWWHAAAQLWQHVWDRGQVPKLWRFAKVTLIRKRGGPKTRPITLTQVIWRVGTKHIARALRPWTLKWASSSDHGGLPGRSTSDVLFQLQAAIKRGVNTAALMDVAGYFDSLNVPAIGRVFNRLGAPPQLLPLLESFYSDAKRLPAIAISGGSLISLLSSTNIGAQIFMDDRTLWIEPRGSLQDLDAALLASADFDQAFSLQLAEDKCFVAAKHHTEATRLLADKWHFMTCGSLELLGVSFDFEGAGAIPKFSLRKAVLRLRLLRWTQAATTSRIMLVRSLVMPCLAWAAGFARPSAKDVQAVQHEVRFLFSSGYGGDVATVAFYELLGWGLGVGMRNFLRLRACWLARAGGSLVTPLLCAEGMLLEPSELFTSALKVFASFRIGLKGSTVNNTSAVAEECPRACTGYLRMVSLVVSSCRHLRFRIRLQGHKRVLADRSSLFHRRAAFLSGGTTWHFEKSVGPRRDQLHLRCLCGALRPSRAHLLWVCPSTADLRSGLDGPKHRGEERLLAKHLDEPPLPPPAVDAEGLIDEAAEAIQTELQESTSIAIATDGSAKDGVAAHAVVVHRCAKAFAGGNSCEDQSSFRAELCALLLALKAVVVAASRGARGSITIAVDCSAALQARFSCPSLPLFSVHFQQLSAEIRCFGIDLHFMWVPAHNRKASWTPTHSSFSAAFLRSLNDAADRAAKDCVARRLKGSLREKWVAEATRVKVWEEAA